MKNPGLSETFRLGKKPYRQQMINAFAQFRGHPITEAQIDEARLSVTEEWIQHHDASIYDGERWCLYLLHGISTIYGLDYARKVFRHKVVNPLLAQCNTVLDYSCGLGFSTAAGAALYPDQLWFGTNLPGMQHEFNLWLMEHLDLPNLLYAEESAAIVGTTDAVCLFEVLEHLINPLESIRKITKRATLLLESSSFTYQAAGHLQNYHLDQEVVSGRVTSRKMPRALREMGFLNLNLFFKGMPRVWVRP